MWADLAGVTLCNVVSKAVPKSAVPRGPIQRMFAILLGLTVALLCAYLINEFRRPANYPPGKPIGPLFDSRNAWTRGRVDFRHIAGTRLGRPTIANRSSLRAVDGSLLDTSRTRAVATETNIDKREPIAWEYFRCLIRDPRSQQRTKRELECDCVCASMWLLLLLFRSRMRLHIQLFIDKGEKESVTQTHTAHTVRV